MNIINLRNTKETYAALSPFDTKADMNAAINAHFKNHGSELTPTARKVLTLISTYACKYLGVCYLAKRTIADKLGVDPRTIRRCCNQLERLGIIEQHGMKRAGGDRRQTSNAIVIMPKCPPEMSAHEPIIKTKNINNTNDTEMTVIREKTADKNYLIKQGLVTKLPSTLQSALAPFFSAEDLYTMTGVIYKAKASVDRSITIEHHEEEYYEAIISVINTYKRGNVRNLEGLLYHAIKAATRRIWLQESLFGA